MNEFGFEFEREPHDFPWLVSVHEYRAWEGGGPPRGSSEMPLHSVRVCKRSGVYLVRLVSRSWYQDPLFAGFRRNNDRFLPSLERVHQEVVDEVLAIGALLAKTLTFLDSQPPLGGSPTGLTLDRVTGAAHDFFVELGFPPPPRGGGRWWFKLAHESWEDVSARAWEAAKIAKVCN